jgi:cytochrome c biogenesis protein CcmG, thiol:disulfide interchange protein DsbE
MGAKSFAVVLAVLAVVGLLGYGLFKKADQVIAVGDPAPKPQLTELASDQSASLEDFRGRWTLLNFWSSWCQPCKVESPALEAFGREHSGERFTVVGVDLEDTRSDALNFVRNLSLTYPQLRAVDSRRLRDQYGIQGRPENVLLDPDGKIALIRRGPVTDDYLQRDVQPLIGAAQ